MRRGRVRAGDLVLVSDGDTFSDVRVVRVESRRSSANFSKYNQKQCLPDNAKPKSIKKEFAFVSGDGIAAHTLSDPLVLVLGEWCYRTRCVQRIERAELRARVELRGGRGAEDEHLRGGRVDQRRETGRADAEWRLKRGRSVGRDAKELNERTRNRWIEQHYLSTFS